MEHTELRAELAKMYKEIVADTSKLEGLLLLVDRQEAHQIMSDSLHPLAQLSLIANAYISVFERCLSMQKHIAENHPEHADKAEEFKERLQELTQAIVDTAVIK